MITNDPRTYGSTYTNGGIQPGTNPYYAGPTAPFFAGPTHAPTAGLETWHLLARIEEMRTQILTLTELVKAGMTHAYGVNTVPFQRPMPGYTASETVRIRESDSHIYCDIFLPQLTLADCEVEVSGNRIICRTRVPVGPLGRWFNTTTQMPRGFENFELPDGRVECLWLCPVAFQSKEVEATFREGFLTIFVPKMEATSQVRHPIKITKETTTRRTGSDMNS